MKKVALGLSLILVLILSCTPTYIVTFSGSTGGTVSDIGGEFDEGTVISVTAQPDTGYEFQGWSDGSTQNPRSITVLESLNLTALFSKQQFAVLTSVQGEGTIQSSGSNAQGEFEYGANARFEAIPSTGWLFDSWEGDVSGTTNPISVSINAPISVRAVFKREKFDLNITIVGQGEVLESVVVQPGQYDYETQVKLTAVPETGWTFSGWSGDLTSTENPVTVTVEEAQDITATFTRKKYDLTVTVVGEGSVTEEIVVQPGQYDYETQVKLTAIPETGWEFSAWSGDLTSTQNPVTVTVEEAQNITATFTRKKYDLNITIEGEGTVTEEVVVQPGQYDYETQVKLTAVPETGWTFSGWSGDLSSTENPVTVTVEEAQDITANFAKVNPLYLDPNGVTIKAQEFAEVGDRWFFEGDEFIIVDDALLRQMVTDDEDVTHVVTTMVKDMSALFADKHVFNQDISSWDISNVISLRGTFRRAYQFNKDISSWDVSKVMDMYELFFEAYAFNQPIGDWDVSNVVNMHLMFKRSSFNQPIGDWNVSNVVTMEGMFGETPFNQNISSWNISNVTNLSGLFAGSSFNGEINSWNTSNVSNFYAVFAHTQFNQSLSNWDVSKATTMHSMFENNQSFNQDISGWNVSQVTDFIDMFNKAEVFNQDISNWCVTLIGAEPVRFLQGNTVMIESKKPIWGQCGEIYLDDNGVTIKARDNAVVGEYYKLTNNGEEFKVVNDVMIREMVSNNEDLTKVVTSRLFDVQGLFQGKQFFNQDIGSWDFSNVQHAGYLFQNAARFNQDISKWNTSNLRTAWGMFMGAESFNQDISEWDMSLVFGVSDMFNNARKFNKPLENWDLRNVDSFEGMFMGASSFNQPLNSWDTSNVTSMRNMFFAAQQFNQDLNDWDVSSVTDMRGLFAGAQKFNGNISNWDVSSVDDMEYMFSNTYSFNANISGWDVSSVTKMKGMFSNAEIFSQDLSFWCVPNIPIEPELMFSRNGDTPFPENKKPVWGTCPEN